MLTMYDSAEAATIPLGAKFAAGYVDGYGSYPDIRRRLPHARRMSIAINADHDADCLDVETGCAHPDRIAGWVKRQRDRGVARPVIYGNTGDLTGKSGNFNILATLREAGIKLSSIRLWSADYPDPSLTDLQKMGKDNPAELTALYKRWAHICGPDTCNKVPVAGDGTQWWEWSYNPDMGRYVSLDQSYLVDSFFGEPKPPTMYPCQGHKSLNGLSQQLHNPVSEILRLTAEHSPGGKFYSGIAGYLNGVFATDTVKVPLNIEVYHPKSTSDLTPKPFFSHGDQTLQGLANTFGCKPADIVQYTAENSPDRVFSKGMAAYLNGVFARSTTHVPNGTHLFYQQ